MMLRKLQEQLNQRSQLAQDQLANSFQKALFKKMLLLSQKLIQVDWNGLRYSYGSSGTGENHAGVYAEEAHRPRRGKRASLAAINHVALPGK
jgi:hypothetical protein